MNSSIFPKPRNITTGSDSYLKKGFQLEYGKEEEDVLKEDLRLIQNQWTSSFGDSGEYRIKLQYSSQIKSQDYELRLQNVGGELLFSDTLGLHYGIMTLKQIWDQSGDTLSEIVIQDGPDVKDRGVLVDISRDKIPTLETMFQIIDILSSLRFNQLQLYNQGYVYEFEQYKYMYPNETPYTKSDIEKINSYCKEKFIDFVPNMNCFGHMDMWLKQPQLKELAECPDGYNFQNMYQRGAGTIDPYDEKAFAFITELVDEFGTNFNSGMFNVNIDEPFELGLGKSKAIADEKGVARVYLDYVKKLNGYIQGKGKTMQMWGDVVFNHPEIIEDLPKDVILLDWIYEGDATFEKHGELMKKHGFSYYLCPGTSSWCTYTGRSDNMNKNIRDAVRTAVKYDATGVLLTDWGDLGHLNYLPVSYNGYAFGGAVTWREDTDEEEILNYVNKVIYQTEEPFSQLIYKLGNYYQQEDYRLFNTTLSFAVMAEKYIFNDHKEFLDKMEIMRRLTTGIAHENNIPFTGCVDNFDMYKVIRYVDELQRELKHVEIGCEDAELIKDEFANNIRMIKHGARLYHIMRDVYPNDIEKTEELFAEMAKDIDLIIKEHYRLWTARNRKGGFSRSSAQMYHLYGLYKKGLKQTNTN